MSRPHPHRKAPQARLLQLQHLVARERRLPIGKSVRRAIVLKLSATFPACAWAFLKMM